CDPQRTRREGRSPSTGPVGDPTPGTVRTLETCYGASDHRLEWARFFVGLVASKPSFHCRRCTLFKDRKTAMAASRSAASLVWARTRAERGQRDPERTRQAGRSPSTGPVGGSTPGTVRTLETCCGASDHRLEWARFFVGLVASKPSFHCRRCTLF